LASTGLWGQDVATARQEAKELNRATQVKLRYLLQLPEDYESTESSPLLLFLHGAGERGDNLELVKKHGPPKLIEGGKSLPFIVVSPQCPSGRWWEPFELAALLDEIEQHYKVDKQRVYVTGLSMGGFGTWALAAYQPNRFAAIAPICGGGEPFTARLYADVPTWAFHGDQDNVVPLARSQSMVDALERAGGKVKFTVYPGVGHDSWSEPYADDAFYQWLLENRKEK
jgi:predicted peptidase